mgnify:FL=1
MRANQDEAVDVLVNHNKDIFVSWESVRDQNPSRYIEQGYLEANDYVRLRTVAERCNCFGAGYKGFQGSGAKHKFEGDTDIKRLKFYPNGEWDNRLTLDGNMFTEFHVNSTENDKYAWSRLTELNQKIALFSHEKVSSTKYEAIFKGLYRVNKVESLKNKKVTYDRISKIMPTYYPKNVVSPKVIAEAYDKEGYMVAHFYYADVLETFQKKYVGRCTYLMK